MEEEEVLMPMLNSDTAYWILDALDRYEKSIVNAIKFPSVSRIGGAGKAACILEITELIGHSLDEGAKRNIISRCLGELSPRPKDGE